MITKPIHNDNGTLSIVASDLAYDHEFADRPMSKAVVETSRHKPDPRDWKHIASNCDERWFLIKGSSRLATLDGNWDIFESNHADRIMLVTRNGRIAA